MADQSDEADYVDMGEYVSFFSLLVVISLETSWALSLLALFLKKVISKCLSNDFLCHDLQFVMLIMMLIHSVTFTHVFFGIRLYLFVQLCSEVMSTEKYYCILFNLF